MARSTVMLAASVDLYRLVKHDWLDSLGVAR